MDKDTVVEVFKHYRLEFISNIEEIEPRIIKLTSSNEKKYIIKNAPHNSIKKQYEVLSKLKQANVPVAPILETMDGMYYVKVGDGYYCLYPFIDGVVIKNIYLLEGKEVMGIYGEAIASLHQSLIQVNASKDFSCDFFLKRIFDEGLKVVRLYEDKNTISVLEDIIIHCKKLKLIGDKLPVQIIHGDLHTENIIYGDKKVNAFIDFENCTTGYRIYDLAFLMVNILMQGYKKESESQWLNLCNALIKSYNKQSPLSRFEFQAIWYCLLASQFLIIDYFYRTHNFDEAKKYLEGFFWIYKNKNIINEALIRYI